MTGALPAEPNAPISVVRSFAGGLPPIQLVPAEKMLVVFAHSITAVGAFGAVILPENRKKGELKEPNEKRFSLELAALTIALLSEVVVDSVVSVNRSVLLAGERPNRLDAPPKKTSLLRIPQSSPKADRSNGFAYGVSAAAMLARLRNETAPSTIFRHAKRRDVSFMGGSGLFDWRFDQLVGKLSNKVSRIVEEKSLPKGPPIK